MDHSIRPVTGLPLIMKGFLIMKLISDLVLVVQKSRKVMVPNAVINSFFIFHSSNDSKEAVDRSIVLSEDGKVDWETSE